MRIIFYYSLMLLDVPDMSTFLKRYSFTMITWHESNLFTFLQYYQSAYNLPIIYCDDKFEIEATKDLSNLPYHQFTNVFSLYYSIRLVTPPADVPLIQIRTSDGLLDIKLDYI